MDWELPIIILRIGLRKSSWDSINLSESSLYKTSPLLFSKHFLYLNATAFHSLVLTRALSPSRQIQTPWFPVHSSPSRPILCPSTSTFSFSVNMTSCFPQKRLHKALPLTSPYLLLNTCGHACFGVPYCLVMTEIRSASSLYHQATLPAVKDLLKQLSPLACFSVRSPFYTDTLWSISTGSPSVSHQILANHQETLSLDPQSLCFHSTQAFLGDHFSTLITLADVSMPLGSLGLPKTHVFPSIQSITSLTMRTDLYISKYVKFRFSLNIKLKKYSYGMALPWYCFPVVSFAGVLLSKS